MGRRSGEFELPTMPSWLWSAAVLFGIALGARQAGSSASLLRFMAITAGYMVAVGLATSLVWALGCYIRQRRIDSR